MSENSTRVSDTIEATGDINIDGLLTGFKWAQDTKIAGSLDTATQTTTLTFGFPASANQYDGYERGEEPSNGFTQLSNFQQDYLRGLLEHLEGTTNLRFQELKGEAAGAATLRLAWTEDNDNALVAWAYIPEDVPWAGDVWLNAKSFSTSSTSVSDNEVGVIMHEFGHALGLKHPHEEENGFGVLPSKFDGPEYTAMTYNLSAAFPQAISSDLLPQTYMWLDIQALQAMYGKNMVTTQSADKYEFNLTQRHFLTIWDAGGVDTIKVTNGHADLSINLTPGSWSDIGTTVTYTMPSGANQQRHKTLFITPDTLIENASGASGDDLITGNKAANKLSGNAGNDKLVGGAGADFLSGGAGNDTMFGGDGADQIWAGTGDQGNDRAFGGAGHDSLSGGNGSDFLIGDTSKANAGGGSDHLFGGDGNDTLLGGSWKDSEISPNGRFDKGEEIAGSAAYQEKLWGGAGNDFLYASNGNDVLSGGNGNDTVEGAAGNDTIYGGASKGPENDVLNGGSGQDVIFSGAGDDRANGGAGADKIYGGQGNDTLNGNSGNDSLSGGSGNDKISGGTGADTFYFANDHGDDQISDFEISTDVLFLENTITDFKSTADIIAATQAVTVGGIAGILIDTGGGNSLFIAGLNVDNLSTITMAL